MILLVNCFISTAQPFDPPGDADPPAASINYYIWLLALVGLIISFYTMFKYTKQLSK